MALTSIALVNLRRRNVAEWVATMEAQGDGEPRTFAGQRIVKSFGPPQIYSRMLTDRDLRPDQDRNPPISTKTLSSSRTFS